MEATTQVDNRELPPGIVALYGPPGSLKTSCGLSWPKHLSVFDFDLGAHRGWRINQMIRDGQVTVHRMALPNRSLTTRHVALEGFRTAWQDFLAQYTADLENPEIKSIQLDTSTMLWGLNQDSYLEELQADNIRKNETVRKQLLQIEFREPNSRMKQVLQAARSYHKNLILVHHETDEYVTVMFEGKPVLDERGNPKSVSTGRKVADGFRYTLGLADWVFRLRVDQHKQVLSPYAVLEKSALGIDLWGLGFTWIDPKRPDNTLYAELQQRLIMLERI